MPLLNVPGTRSGDSLPSELRSGVREYCGTPIMPSLRLSASGAGLSGMSVWYGASEGPWGYRAYNWPPFGYRGMSGLGQTCVAYDVEGNCIQYDTTYDTSQYNTPGTTAFCDLNPTDPGCNPANVTGVNYDTTNVNVGGATVQAQAPAGYTGPKVCAAGQNCGSAPSGYQWIPVLNQAGNTLAQVLAVAQGGGYTSTPRGITVAGSAGVPTSSVQAPTVSASLLTNPTSMMLILGAGLLLVMMMQPGKR